MPKAPCGAVVSTKKTMIVPCIVTSARYCSGVMMPPRTNGKCAAGHTRWKRIRSERTMPIVTAASARKKYCRPTTLWSVLKMQRRRKPVGRFQRCAHWAAACALEEAFVIGFRDYIQEAVHRVVAQPAQLRADNLVLPDSVRGEMNGNHHAGHGVLLQAQFAHEKIVDHVLRAQQQLDGTIDRDGQRRDNDIVFARGIVRIEAQRISGGRADQAGIEPAEFAVGARIAKRVDKLRGGDFDLNRARLGAA